MIFVDKTRGRLYTTTGAKMQSRETGNFVIARACGFHDHDDPLNQALWGTITTR